jgi:hypothetical protein
VPGASDARSSRPAAICSNARGARAAVTENVPDPAIASWRRRGTRSVGHSRVSYPCFGDHGAAVFNLTVTAVASAR